MLQDVIQPLPEQDQLPIDEISSPISARLFELCENELFQETLQNSSVTSSTSNCCHEDICSYAINLSSASASGLDLENINKINSNSNSNNSNISSTTSTATINNNNNNSNSNNNLSIIFDSHEEIDNDISASIDFSSSQSQSFLVPLPQLVQEQQQLDFTKGFSYSIDHEYPNPNDSIAVAPVPLINGLPCVFEDDCISSIPSSYMPLNNPSSPSSCSYLSPAGLGLYMPQGQFASALGNDNNSALFAAATILLPSELQTQHDLDYQGENAGIYCPDPLQGVFNIPSDFQALGPHESQNMVGGGGAGNSTTLAPEMSHLEESTMKVGKLSVEQRKEKIHRYMKKRNERNFSKKIKYACRKTLADSRPRVRGRFAKNDDFGESNRPSGSNHEEDDEIVVKENDDLVDSSDIFAHISGLNSFKCNYSIQSLI